MKIEIVGTILILTIIGCLFILLIPKYTVGAFLSQQSLNLLVTRFLTTDDYTRLVQIPSQWLWNFRVIDVFTQGVVLLATGIASTMLLFKKRKKSVEVE